MDDTENADPRVGSEVQSRYRILSRIADGSMGVVYRAERLQLGRHVAIKFLHASYAADPQFIQRFERETRVMSKLSHPHCVSVIDFGVEGSPYVVMEYVSGRTLRALLEDGPVSVDRALHITRQILGALAHAHSQDIVHRDIKPANIMLTEATGTGDHVRILDFGLATLRGAVSSDLSQSQIVVGTPNYMSPEQSMAIKVDGRSDLYSTGVVLFELLTGEKPFSADDTFELLTLHRTAPVPKLADVAPDADFPPGLQTVIERALAKQPEDRYPGAIEMAQALDEAMRPRAAAPPPPPPPPPITATSDASFAFAPTESFEAHRDRHGGLGFLGTLLVLGLLGGGAWAGWRYWQERDADAELTLARAPLPAPAPVAHEPPVAPPEPTAVTPAPALVTPDAAPVVVVDAAPPALDAAAPAAADEVADEPPLPAEEQVEPVEPVAEEEAEADVAEPTTAEAATVAAPPEPEPEPEPVTEPAPEPAAPAPVARRPNPVDTVSEAVALIRAGKREQAIRALLALKKKNPKSAYVPYLLGNLYFSKRWWTVGMDYYYAAIAKNRLYRGKRILNQNVIRALGDRRTSAKASRLFTRSIGRAALPYLRRAARSDHNPKVRRAAAYLVRRLSRRR